MARRIRRGIVRGGAWGRRPRFAIALAAALLLMLQPPARSAPSPIAAPADTPGLGGCWGDGATGPRSTDARFIVMMIPHHEGAIAMAELALTRARRPEIRALAQRIIASQGREISQMRQWYRQWYGAAVPDWRSAGGYGMGPGMGLGGGMGAGMGMGPAMPGMATSLEALRSAPDVDRAFIEQMIPHHRIGVMMASHAGWNSEHPQMRELEAAMVRVQSQEIEQMARWHRQWYGARGG